MEDPIIITTIKGRQKLAQMQTGAIPLAPIAQVGFGTGGYSSALGAIDPPSPSATVVSGQFLVKDIEGYTFPKVTESSIEFVLEKVEGNGNNISAFGLYDTDGDLVILMHTEPTPKTADTWLKRTINNAF